MVPPSNLCLGDLMDRRVLVVAGERSLASIVPLLKDQQVSHVVVQDAAKPLGMLTERDLVRLLRHPIAAQAQAAQVMSAPIVTVPARLGFRAAYEQLCMSRLRHLIVVDGFNQVLGVACEGDFLDHVGLELCQSVQRLDALVDWNVPALDVATPVLQAIDRIVHDKRGCVMVRQGQHPIGLFTEHQAPRALAQLADGAVVTLGDVVQRCAQVFSHDSSTAQVLGQLVAERVGYVLVHNPDTGATGVIAQSRLLESVRSSIHVDIAHRQLAQEQVNLAQESLQQQIEFSGAVVDAVMDGISVCQAIDAPPYIRFTVWNVAMREMTGYTQEEINDRGWYQTIYIDPDTQQRARQRMEQMRLGEHLCREPWVITRKDGQQRVVEISTRTVILPGGSSQTLAVMHDCTARRQMEKQLNNSETNFRLFFDTIDDFLFVLDVQGNIQFVNRAVTQRLGYTQSALVGQSVLSVHPPARREEAGRIVAAMLAGKEGFCPVPLITADGSLIPVETRVVQGIWNGEPALFGLSRDVTERNSIHQALRESEFLLLESQRIGQLGGFRADPVHNAVKWTDGIYAICELPLDYQPDLASGLDPYLPESRQRVVASLDAALQTGTPFSIEVQIQGARTGKIKWNELRGFPHFDEHGKVDYVMGTLQDISQRKQTEMALAQARDEAEAASRAKSAFLATMSHEIRTPMNGVLGMAQLLLTPNLEQSERFEYARIILSSGQALMTLLNDILDLSKIEAGKFLLDAKVFEPESILRDTCSLFSGAAEGKNLQLVHHWLGPAGQRYQADAHRLRQMISNLVGNAIKFTHMGSVNIEAKALQQDDSTALLEFSVTDSGIGIAPEKQVLLFKPFTQADSSTTREFGGSGLGLSIVANLARAMGGNVGIHSEAGHGARFWFTAQVVVIAPGQPTRSADQPEPSQAMHARSDDHLRGRVLVAEDNPVNALVIESMLTRLGLQVTLVGDGQQAVAALVSADAAQQADLVLMDLHMPVLDGYAATRQIRQWEIDTQRERRPIIALTADAFEEDHQHCLSVGMDDFLTKPVSMEAVRTALGRWLPHASTTEPEPPPTGHLMPDSAQIEGILNELVPLVAGNKFMALNVFQALERALNGTALETELGSISQNLQAFNFKLAQEQLRQLALTQHWSLPT